MRATEPVGGTQNRCCQQTAALPHTRDLGATSIDLLCNMQYLIYGGKERV